MTGQPPPIMTRCSCGCGREIKSLDRYGRPRRFVQGHGSVFNVARIDRLQRAAKAVADEARRQINLNDLSLVQREEGRLPISLAVLACLHEALEGPR